MLDRLQGMKVIPAESLSLSQMFLDLLAQLVWACEDIVGHFFAWKIEEAKL